MAKVWNKSEEYNAKRGSEPSKTFDFRIDFGLIFNVFFRTHTQSPLFEGQSARLCSQVRFWTDFRFSRCPKNDPWTAIFNPTGAKRCSTLSRPEHPGADLGAMWRRKRSKDALSSIWGGFLVDFGWILIIFERTFNAFFQNSIAVYDNDGPTILAPIQIMWPGGVRASRLNTARPGEGRRPC